jgi:hypothetical protein
MEQHSVNTENRATQDSGGGRKPEEGKGGAPSQKPAPRLAEKEEEQRGYRFNRLRPMTKVKQMW